MCNALDLQVSVVFRPCLSYETILAGSALTFVTIVAGDQQILLHTMKRICWFWDGSTHPVIRLM